jgi:hypothetical protein
VGYGIKIFFDFAIFIFEGGRLKARWVICKLPKWQVIPCCGAILKQVARRRKKIFIGCGIGPEMPGLLAYE